MLQRLLDFISGGRGLVPSYSHTFSISGSSLYERSIELRPEWASRVQAVFIEGRKAHPAEMGRRNL